MTLSYKLSMTQPAGLSTTQSYRLLKQQPGRRQFQLLKQPLKRQPAEPSKMRLYKQLSLLLAALRKMQWQPLCLLLHCQPLDKPSFLQSRPQPGLRPAKLSRRLPCLLPARSTP